jgi:hypothetical protein
VYEAESRGRGDRARAEIAVNHSRIPLSTIAAMLVGAAVALAAPPAALSDPPLESTASFEWESANQVLEIPQACTRDGVVVTCAPSDADSLRDDGAAAGVDPSSAGDSSTEEVSGTEDSAGDPAWGTVQDYENQGIAGGPVAIYTMRGTMGTLPPSAYGVPATPIITGSIYRAPRVGIFGPPSSPWMAAPRMATGPAAMPLTMPGRGFPLH